MNAGIMSPTSPNNRASTSSSSTFQASSRPAGPHHNTVSEGLTRMTQNPTQGAAVTYALHLNHCIRLDGYHRQLKKDYTLLKNSPSQTENFCSNADNFCRAAANYLWWVEYYQRQIYNNALISPGNFNPSPNTTTSTSKVQLPLNLAMPPQPPPLTTTHTPIAHPSYCHEPCDYHLSAAANSSHPTPAIEAPLTELEALRQENQRLSEKNDHLSEDNHGLTHAKHHLNHEILYYQHTNHRLQTDNHKLFHDHANAVRRGEFYKAQAFTAAHGEKTYRKSVEKRDHEYTHKMKVYSVQVREQEKKNTEIVAKEYARLKREIEMRVEMNKYVESELERTRDEAKKNFQRAMEGEVEIGKMRAEMKKEKERGRWEVKMLRKAVFGKAETVRVSGVEIVVIDQIGCDLLVMDEDVVGEEDDGEEDEWVLG